MNVEPWRGPSQRVNPTNTKKVDAQSEIIKILREEKQKLASEIAKLTNALDKKEKAFLRLQKDVIYFTAEKDIENKDKVNLCREIIDLKKDKEKMQDEIKKAQDEIESLKTYNSDCDKMNEVSGQQIDLPKDEKLALSIKALEDRISRADRRSQLYQITSILMLIFLIVLTVQSAIPKQEL